MLVAFRSSSVKSVNIKGGKGGHILNILLKNITKKFEPLNQRKLTTIKIWRQSTMYKNKKFVNVKPLFLFFAHSSMISLEKFPLFSPFNHSIIIQYTLE